MSFGKTITVIGVSLLFLYILTQILNFYGIGQDSYGIYLGFFLFMLLSITILPNKDVTLKYTTD
jgi:small neutral amino acid transporter SnatA (MarC family)